MNRIKKFISILVACTFCVLLLTGCGGSGGSGSSASSQAKKDAVLALLNNVRASNGVSALSEDEEADSVAARIANLGVDYGMRYITEAQFDAEFKNAYRTKVHGGSCVAMYSDNIIPTKASNFSGQEVAYRSGSIVGIAIREYRNAVLTIIIVY